MTQSAAERGNAGSGSRTRGRIGALGLLLVLIFVFQFAMLCYFNFTQLKNHMGYDSSWAYLRSVMMWQEKALTSHNWHESTSLQLDTHMIPVSLLYGLTGDIWLAEGIGNTAMVCLLLLFMWKILARMKVKFTARMTALNLVICPFLTNGFEVFNDLGYFSCLLSGAAQYCLRALVPMMIVYEFLKIVQDRKMGYLPWVIFPLCMLCGGSSGVYLIMIILAPCLAYLVEDASIRNDWKRLIRKESVFVFLCCAAVAAGKVLSGMLLDYEASDTSSTWTALTDLGTNFSAVLRGFPKLMQVLPLTGREYHPIMSVTGVLRVFAMAVFAVIVISMAAAFRRAFRDPAEGDGLNLLLVNVVAVDFLILGMHNASYGTIIFEERYLIVTFLAGVLMTAMFLDRLEDRRVVTVLLALVLPVSILAVDVHSDINYLRATNGEWQMEEIQDMAEAQDAGIVYVWGDDVTVIGRSLRVMDLDRVYKMIPDGGGYYRHHFGDYYTYDTNEEYTGPTLLVCPAGQHLVPDSVLAEYTKLEETLPYRVKDNAGKTLKGYLEVYVCDHNPHLW